MESAEADSTAKLSELIATQRGSFWCPGIVICFKHLTEKL